jgi:TolB-like protein
MTISASKWNTSDQVLLNECLDKLLLSPIFDKSPRQQDLMRYLVKETLAGNAQRLKGYTLGVEIFARGADFDPNVDAIVRVEVGRLRIKLREYYSLHGQNDAVLFNLPKGSYAIDITLRTNETSKAQAHEQVPGPIHKPWPNFIENIASLAVLPFNNLSANTEQEYLVDGIVDNLIFELSRLSGLLIISRQSSFIYKGGNKTSKQIGSELGVKFLLEGTIQISGNRLRINTRLIDTNTESCIWTERYEGNLQEIFSLQDEITLSIVKALQIKLSPAEAELFGHEGTESVEAHDALLRGMACHWKYSPKFIEEARVHFTRAIELDANYASAHGWLARTLLYLWNMKWDIDDSLRYLAFEHAQKAVAINDKISFTHCMLGWAHLWLKHCDPSIAALRQAVALDLNNFEAHIFLSMALSSAGFGEEGLYYIEKAQRLNPHSSPFYEFTHGLAHYALKDYDKAIDCFKRGCVLNAHFAPNFAFLCTTYALLGMENELQASREAFLAILGGDKSRVLEPPWTNKALGDEYERLVQLAGLR